MWPDLQFPVNLVTFTEEILNGKLHFWCSVVEAFSAQMSTLLKILFTLKNG